MSSPTAPAIRACAECHKPIISIVSTRIFPCGHVYHEACFSGDASSENCPLCSSSSSSSSAEPSPSSSAEERKNKSTSKLVLYLALHFRHPNVSELARLGLNVETAKRIGMTCEIAATRYRLTMHDMVMGLGMSLDDLIALRLTPHIMRRSLGWFDVDLLSDTLRTTFHTLRVRIGFSVADLVREKTTLEELRKLGIEADVLLDRESDRVGALAGLYLTVKEWRDLGLTWERLVGLRISRQNWSIIFNSPRSRFTLSDMLAEFSGEHPNVLDKLGLNVSIDRSTLSAGRRRANRV